MTEATCHCGGVRIRVDRAPSEVTDCSCSICRRYGVLWAYYHPEEVRVVFEGPSPDVYQWGRKSLDFHRCHVCGCVTHWSPTDRDPNRMGINARLLPPELLSSARRRLLDGAVTERYLDEDD